MRNKVLMNAESARGFTLIEMMIAVAIVGILAAIAYPSYQESIRKSRRADAKSALTEAAALQEKWYFQHNQYTDNESDHLNGSTSPEGYYTLDVQNGACGNTTDCFLMVATATGAQASDTQCFKLTLDSSGKKRSYSNGDPGAETTDTANCW